MSRPATDVLRRCDRYLDTAPRSGCDVESVGPFEVFLSRRPWSYYARPRPGVDAVTPAEVAAVRARQRERRQDENLEWVVDLVPGLDAVAADAGLEVVLHPLLARGAVPVAMAPPRLPPGHQVRLLGADDDALPAGRAVTSVGFAELGTAVGAGSPDDVRARLDAADDTVRAGDEHVRTRIRAGVMRMAVVVSETDGVVAAGFHQPVADIPDDADGRFSASEIVGVATLPSARRQGLGSALTWALAADASAMGMDLLLLSASDDDVARVYERLGFDRVGQVGEASPAGD